MPCICVGALYLFTSTGSAVPRPLFINFLIQRRQWTTVDDVGTENKWLQHSRRRISKFLVPFATTAGHNSLNIPPCPASPRSHFNTFAFVHFRFTPHDTEPPYPRGFSPPVFETHTHVKSIALAPLLILEAINLAVHASSTRIRPI